MRLSIPASARSARAQDRRTASLLRSSSFIGPIVPRRGWRKCRRRRPTVQLLQVFPARSRHAAGRSWKNLRRVRPLDTAAHSMLARRWPRQARPPALGRQRANRGEPVPPLTSGNREQQPPNPSVDRLFRLLKPDLDGVNAVILSRMHSPVALIPELAGHIVSAGGKRLRPMLTLGCARLAGYRGTRHIA